MTLTQPEFDRYARHLSLAGFGQTAQEKLQAARVLVVGAGGLGCPALLYLAAAGVGRIELLDADCVDLSNLQRQVLYTNEDIGQPKAEAAARRLRAFNPLIEIVPRCERFTRANALERLRDCDLLLDGSDNFATRYLVNDACVLADKPFVYGAIHDFEGQASVFNWRGGPTYRCLFPQPAQADARPSCAEAGVLGVLPGLIGTLMATEAIKLITDIGETLSGRLLLWNALTMQMRTLVLTADPNQRHICQLPPEFYGLTCMVESDGESDEIDAAELYTLMPSVQLIDVRSAWERGPGAIAASVQLPLAALQAGLGRNELALLNPARPTVVYCAFGVRSRIALSLLRERYGFTQVRSLRGGYRAFSDPRNQRL